VNTETVYSGRREADLVMTSTGHVGPSTHLSDYPPNQEQAALCFDNFRIADNPSKIVASLERRSDTWPRSPFTLEQEMSSPFPNELVAALHGSRIRTYSA